MGLPVSRVTDIGVGTCSAHKKTKSVVVTIISGANTVITNGLPTATRISTGICSCGHGSIVVTVSVTVRAEKMGIHRLTDTGLTAGGSYAMVSGSPTVMAGG